MISGDTTVARLLDEHPELLDFLVTYHEHFARLRDEALRKMMAPRVTVSEAARMAGVDPDELLHALRRAAGEPDAGSPDAGGAPAAAAAQPMPIALAALPADRRVDLDLRDDIRRGEEPFARIMAAVKRLGDDEALVIRTPFEPIPLYDVLGKRGLAHWTETRAADDCAVWFYRAAVARMADVCPAMADEPAGAPAPRTVTLDVRGLEPPLPMVLVLERLEALRAGEQLEIFHDRRPMFLYPQLDSRGFVHETEESEGLVRIRVRHAARASA